MSSLVDSIFGAAGAGAAAAGGGGAAASSAPRTAAAAAATATTTTHADRSSTITATTSPTNAAARLRLFATPIALPAPRAYPARLPSRKRQTAEAAAEKSRGSKKPRKPAKAPADGEEAGKRVVGAEAEETTTGVVMIGPQQQQRQRPLADTDDDSNNEDGDDDIDDDDDADARTVFVGNLPLRYTRRQLARLFVARGGCAVASARIRSVPAAGVKLPPHLMAKAGTAAASKSSGGGGGKSMALVKKVCGNTGALDATAKASVHGYVVLRDMASVARALLLNHAAVPVHTDDADDDDAGTDDGSTTPRRRGRTNNNAKVANVRHIRVDRASDPVRDPARTVFVGNLPYQADEESLARHFARHLAVDHTHAASAAAATTPATRAGDTAATAGSGSRSGGGVEAVRIVRDRDTHLCKGFGYVLFTTAALAARALRTCHGTKYNYRTGNAGNDGNAGDDKGNGKKSDATRHTGAVLRVLVCGKRSKNMRGATTTRKGEARRNAARTDAVGALHRVLTKELRLSATTKPAAHKKRGARPPADPHLKAGGGGGGGGNSMVSKRAAAVAKTGRRIKKIERRVHKGMGKAAAARNA